MPSRVKSLNNDDDGGDDDKNNNNSNNNNNNNNRLTSMYLNPSSNMFVCSCSLSKIYVVTTNDGRGGSLKHTMTEQIKVGNVVKTMAS